MIPRNAPGGHAISHLYPLAIDSIPSHIYIAPMADDANVQFEHELKRLEKRVDALVQVCDQLQDENRSLKQRQDTLTAERANLLQKNEQVRARVEAMIGRLKAMEQGG
jgi:cell division protein ZapB